MPRVLAETMRAALALENRDQLVLEKNPWNKTGFTGVSKIGKHYFARINVPGDGRGGTKKRRQHSLPCGFDTAEEAAQSRALIMKGFKASG